MPLNYLSSFMKLPCIVFELSQDPVFVDGKVTDRQTDRRTNGRTDGQTEGKPIVPSGEPVGD